MKNLRKVGRGSYGKVYSGVDPQYNCTVCIKVINEDKVEMTEIEILKWCKNVD
mgnify:CR=1 FL=1